VRGFHIAPGIGAACIEQVAELFEQGPAQAYHVEVPEDIGYARIVLAETGWGDRQDNVLIRTPRSCVFSRII